MRSHTFDDVDELTDAAYRVRVAQRLLRWQMRRLQQAIAHHATCDNSRMSMPVSLRMPFTRSSSNSR